MKKNFKGLLILGSAAPLLISGLTACGKKYDPSTTIRMWTTFNSTYQAVIEKAIAVYEEQYPGYHVEYTKYSGSYSDISDAIAKGFAGGDYPDITAVYPDSIATFIMAGRSVDLTPYMEDETNGWSAEDFADIPEVYIEEGQNYFVEGTYSLPLSKSTEAMFYNRGRLIGLDLSLYDEEINDGEPLDEEYIENLTWEELFDHLCPAIVAYNNDASSSEKIIDTSDSNWAVVGYDSDDNLFITLAEQYGYAYTSLDQQSGIGSVDFVNDGMKSLMKTFNKAYTNHYVTTQGIYGKYCNYLSTAGKMLFSIGSTGGISYQFSDTTKFDVGVAPIPQAAGKETKAISQGPSFTCLKYSDAQYAESHAQQCWNFYKILTSTDICVEWATSTGYAPIRYSAAQSEAYLNYSNEERYALNTLARMTARNARYVPTMNDYLFTSPVFYGSDKARTAVKGLAADCIGNKGNGLIDDETLNTFFQNAYNNAI